MINADLTNDITIGDLAAVKHDLASGANINFVGDGGFTPLLTAIFYGNREIVTLLIERGANIDAVSHTGKTAMSLANNCKNIEDKNHIISALKPALLNASVQSKAIVSDWSDEDNADIQDEINAELMEDLSMGNLDGVKFGLRHHADVNYIDADGYSALTMAAYFGHSDILELIIKNGADLHALTKGKSALMLAHEYDDDLEKSAKMIAIIEAALLNEAANEAVNNSILSVTFRSIKNRLRL